MTGAKEKTTADNANLYTGYCANFSGNWNNGDNAGPFQFNVNYTASNSNSNLGTHQMFSTLTVQSFWMVLLPVPGLGAGAGFNINGATVALPLGKT